MPGAALGLADGAGDLLARSGSGVTHSRAGHDASAEAGPRAAPDSISPIVALGEPPAATTNTAAPDGIPSPAPDSPVAAPPDFAPPAARARRPAAPHSPEAKALDNARRGIWVMNENQDGWVLLGADRKPVVRKDRSRVAFYLRDAARLAKELAPSDDTDTATAIDPVPLAPLDFGYNRDWDPQAFKSWLADITKIAKLLAYDYVRFTEPQEAVRRAVSDILQNPTYVKEPHIRAWAPGKYDIEAVKFVAATLRKRAVGPEMVEGDGGDVRSGMAGAETVMAPFGADMRGGMPRDHRGLGANLMKAGVASDQANPADADIQFAEAGVTEGQLQQSQAPIPQREPAVRSDFGRPQRKPTDSPHATIIENITPRPPVERLPEIDQRLSKNHIMQPWAAMLSREFETFKQPNDGYGTYQLDPKKKGQENRPELYALGKYQMRAPALIDIAMMTRDGRATGKYGIHSWGEFLNNPDAQEAAMIDWAEKLVDYMHKYGIANRIGRTITGIKDEITITEGGLIAAMHKQGWRGTLRYLEWLEQHDWNSRDHQHEMPHDLKDGFLSIETRLRRFQNNSYRQPR